MIFLILFTFNLKAAESTARIDVVKSVRVSPNRTVQLGDIANLAGFSKRDRENLAALKITQSGKRGTEQKLEAQQVSRWIAKKIRSLRLSPVPRVQIPEIISIQVPDAILTVDIVERKLTSVWKVACEACEFSFSHVVLPEILEDVAFDGLRWRMEPEIPKGTFSVPLDVTEVTGNSRVYWITGRLDVYRMVPVATKSISPGEIFEKTFLKLEKRNVTFASDGIPEIDKLVGKKSRTTISAGQIVWSGLTQKDLAFRRGDIVRLNATGSNFAVSTMGVAEQDANVGDLAKIKSSSSGKMLSGVAVGKNEVRVE